MADSGDSVLDPLGEDGREAESVASGRATERSGAGMSDAELQTLLDTRQTQITVIGCGGGGGNTVDRMADAGIQGAELIAVNTDAQHLADIRADAKLFIGKQLTNGRGTGSRPSIGEQAAQESINAITDAVEDTDMVFLTAGLGGGTGTGASPVIAKAAREAGALTIAIVTMPFTSEGEVRRKNAQAGLARLQETTDTVIVIPNDRLLNAAGTLPVQQAFQVADEVLMESVRGVTELITTPSLMNLDFADLRTVMKTGGVAAIGIGESESKTDRARDAALSAIRSPMLDVDISGAHAALVNVTGGPDMSIEEAERIVEEIHDRVDADARIIWGAAVDDQLEGTIRTMIVATGVSSPQIYGTAEMSQTG